MTFHHPRREGTVIDSEHFERILRQNPDALMLVYDLLRFGPGGRALNMPVPSTAEIASHLARSIERSGSEEWNYRISVLVHDEKMDELRDLWKNTMEDLRL